MLEDTATLLWVFLKRTKGEPLVTLQVLGGLFNLWGLR